MKEIKETVILGDVGALYPGVSKVTVDAQSKTAYVFIGKSNRAITVTGEAFDALAKIIPGEKEDGSKTESGQADEITAEDLQGVEQPEEPAKTRPKRGKKES